jgi:hypothetical protein
MAKKTEQERRPQQVLGEKAAEYLKKVEALQKKMGIGSVLTVDFPNRKRTPLLGRVAMWVVRMQGGIINTRFYLR